MVLQAFKNPLWTLTLGKLSQIFFWTVEVSVVNVYYLQKERSVSQFFKLSCSVPLKMMTDKCEAYFVERNLLCQLWSQPQQRYQCLCRKRNRLLVSLVSSRTNRTLDLCKVFVTPKASPVGHSVERAVGGIRKVKSFFPCTRDSRRLREGQAKQQSNNRSEHFRCGQRKPSTNKDSGVF